MAFSVFAPAVWRFNRYMLLVGIWGWGYPIGISLRDKLIGARIFRFYLADACFVAFFTMVGLWICLTLSANKKLKHEEVIGKAQIIAVGGMVTAVINESIQFFVGRGDWVDILVFVTSTPLVLMLLQISKRQVQQESKQVSYSCSV
jgi:hypothetical protein